MGQILDITQLSVAVILIILILLQERSGGTSGLFGGSEGTVYQTRRGLEKTVFIGTIVLTGAFLVLSLLNLIF
jgi:protein translocase SecG subunit